MTVKEFIQFIINNHKGFDSKLKFDMIYNGHSDFMETFKASEISVEKDVDGKEYILLNHPKES
jgi:hypothetical protein